MRQHAITDAGLLALLNGPDQLRFHTIKNKTRQRQFAMGRWLIKHGLSQQFSVAKSDNYELTNYSQWRQLTSDKRYSVSISHSSDYVAVAIADFPCELGIDIEQHKSRNFSELLKVFSTTEEQHLIANLADIKSMFYRLWTAKEAFLKVTQKPIDAVVKQDLSPCLLSGFAQTSSYQSYSGELAKGDYSYCVMTNAAKITSIEVFQLNCASVEP